MTVLMAVFLQLPNGACARHLFDSSSSSDSSGKSDLDDMVEIGLNERIEQHSSLPKRTRLHKRHSENLFIQHHLEESAADLEWVNPCNGFFEPSSEDVSSFVPPPSYFLNILRRDLSTEFHNINQTMKVINITDLGTWGELKKFYSYLPRVTKNSRINLKTWYSGIQIYIGAFAHLGRMQYKYDHAKHMYSTGLTHELNELLMSARSILCQIETTINGSFPFPINQKKLISFTREAMNDRLKFLTNERSAHRSDRTLLEPEMVDLQFVKSKYFYYLRRMWRVVHKRSKRSGRTQTHKRISLDDSTEFRDSGSTSEEQNLSVSYSASSPRSSGSESFELSAEYGSRTGRATRRNSHNRRRRKQQRKH